MYNWEIEKLVSQVSNYKLLPTTPLTLSGIIDAAFLREQTICNCKIEHYCQAWVLVRFAQVSISPVLISSI